MIPSMTYMKSAKFVPDKGQALTIYELNEDGTIARFVTHLTGTGETTRNEKPVVKRLYRPETCQPSSPEEFAQFWGA